MSRPRKDKHGEELPTRQSSCKCVIVDDKVECCMACLRRRKRQEKGWKSKRKTKYRT